MTRVRILIADDHELVRTGLRALLAAHAGWEVCGEAVDGEQAVEHAARLKPDVALLDVSMPRLGGLEAAARIARDSPATRILMITQHDAAQLLPLALRAGAAGCVSKAELSAQLLAAIAALIRPGAHSVAAAPDAARSGTAPAPPPPGEPPAAAEAHSAYRKLRDAAMRALQLHEEDRRRIARELHDGAGQTLAALSMELMGLQDRPGTPAALAAELGRAVQLLQHLTEEIRTAQYLLHPPLLEEAGLAGALQWYVAALARRGGIAIALQLEESPVRLPRALEAAVLHIVQEACTNVQRHSGSRSAQLRLSCESGVLCVDIADAGRGIPAERLRALERPGAGLGIALMRERARHFGGELTLSSSPSGTRIVVRLPLPPAAAQSGVAENSPTMLPLASM
ncbi:MAG TPA: response regulator [Steroidobacteraceae bacterium]|jgi:signal transduction histidine kinase|nr:response regulator [Steroidobacteraceae bacterium]